MFRIGTVFIAVYRFCSLPPDPVCMVTLHLHWMTWMWTIAQFR